MKILSSRTAFARRSLSEKSSTAGMANVLITRRIASSRRLSVFVEVNLDDGPEEIAMGGFIDGHELKNFFKGGASACNDPFDTSDIPLLARHFVSQSAIRNGLTQPTLSESASAHLQRLAWKGNVRELANVMERAVLLAGHGPILPEHCPPEQSGD